MVVLVERKHEIMRPLYILRCLEKEGYHQLVWTDGTNTFIEESGTMNIMFQINDVLITPDEDHDTILRGITKRSVIEVAKNGELKWRKE